MIALKFAELHSRKGGNICGPCFAWRVIFITNSLCRKLEECQQGLYSEMNLCATAPKGPTPFNFNR